VAISARTGRSRFTLILLVLTSLTAITLDFRGVAFLDGARSTVLDVLGPVRTGVDTVVSPLADAWNGVFDYGDLEAENERLRAELDEARGEALEAAGENEQNQELLELNRLDSVRDIPSVAARVVSDPLSNFELVVEIDRGSGDGVAEGMPVVSGAGLVGRVVQVSSQRSRVRLLTDPSLKVGVVLTRSGEDGLAGGTGRGRSLSLTLVPADVDVAVGEVVKTIGTEQFPPDVPVARVRRAEETVGSPEQRISLTPVVDLEHVRFVKVLLWDGTR
jgi:rod shape-determining protein MreC